MSDDKNPCRCGFQGTGDHLCHGKGYTCTNTGSFRLYNAQAVALAGVQMKLQGTDTWACDSCWDAFKAATTRTLAVPPSPKLWPPGKFH
jgi:hypothetical protein